MSLVLRILEYGASCCDQYREDQIKALDRVPKKTSKFANHVNDSGLETLAQRRNIARICAMFKVYTGEWAWKSIGDRLKGPCYLSRDDHIRKIRARKQRTYMGKCSFVNRAVKLWSQQPAEAQSHIFRERVRKVIISEEK